MIIAIDGPAASGKGTLGKKLAVHYGFRHLDTGLLYRAVAKALLDAGHAANDEARAIAAAKAIDPSRFDETALKRMRSARRRRSSPPSRACAPHCSIFSRSSPRRLPARCSTAATSAP